MSNLLINHNFGQRHPVSCCTHVDFILWSMGIFFYLGDHMEICLQYFKWPLVPICHFERQVSSSYDISRVLKGSAFSLPVFQWPDSEDLASSRWTGQHLGGDWQCGRGGKQLNGRYRLGYEWSHDAPALHFDCAPHCTAHTIQQNFQTFQKTVSTPWDSTLTEH